MLGIALAYAFVNLVIDRLTMT